MKTPENELERLGFVQSLQILETPVEECFERITRLVSRVFDAPIAAISIIDENREWFKSILGSDVAEVPRATSFGAATILTGSALVVQNASEDSRFVGNPLLDGHTPVCFFAGFPLVIAGDVRIGTLGIYDVKPRVFTGDDIQALDDFGESATSEIKARLMRTVYSQD